MGSHREGLGGRRVQQEAWGNSKLRCFGFYLLFFFRFLCMLGQAFYRRSPAREIFLWLLY